jgi:hypothetical protein
MTKGIGTVFVSTKEQTPLPFQKELDNGVAPRYPIRREG